MEMIEVYPKKPIHYIAEVLQRMGIVDNWKHIVYPSCYLYEEEGHYYICHFKELILLTNENAFSNIEEVDMARKDSIIQLLKEWGMIDVDEYDKRDTIYVRVIPYSSKQYYTVIDKFNPRILEKGNEDDG